MYSLAMLWMGKRTRSRVMLALTLIIISIPSSTVATQYPTQSPCIGVQHDTVDEHYGAVVGGTYLGGAQYRRTIGSSIYWDINPDFWVDYITVDEKDEDWKKPSPVEVRLYRIEVDGRPLNGWIHVVVKINEKSPFYKEGFGILQMNGRVSLGGDDSVKNHRGGGEFVYDFPKCDGHEKDEVPVKYQFMPCGGVSSADQTMPYGFQYVRPATGPPYVSIPWIKHPELAPAGPHTYNEFHLNFRFSSQACNHPEWLTIATFAHFAKNNRFGASQEILMNPDYIVGAADPIPRPGTYKTINCDTEYSKPNDDLKFIKEAPAELGRDVFDRTKEPVCGVAATHTFTGDVDSKGKVWGPNEPTLFGGRCKPDDKDQQAKINLHIVNKIDFRKNVNICKPEQHLIDPSTGEPAIEYQDYIKTKTDLSLQCLPCPTVPPRPVTDKPTTPTTTKPIMIESINSITSKKQGIMFAGNQAALRIWDSRIIHGILMTILTFFVSPINVFMTRFFKETFLSQRILHLHVWYFVHLLSIGVTSFLYLVGLFRIATNQPAGVSLSVSAQIHRALGWSSIAMFILMAVFGGFRAIVRKIRTIIIAAHWTVGVTIYLMNYACVLMSLWIPGSPAASVDVTEMNITSFNQLVLFITGAWFLFDIIMNIAMIFMIKSMDKKLGLTRRRFWFPSPIPVISEHETREIVGSKMRKIMLAVYCIVALVVTIVICMLIRLSSTDGRGLGEMTCTHKFPSGAFAGKGQCE